MELCGAGAERGFGTGTAAAFAAPLLRTGEGVPREKTEPPELEELSDSVWVVLQKQMLRQRATQAMGITSD